MAKRTRRDISAGRFDRGAIKLDRAALDRWASHDGPAPVGEALAGLGVALAALRPERTGDRVSARRGREVLARLARNLETDGPSREVRIPWTLDPILDDGSPSAAYLDSYSPLDLALLWGQVSTSWRLAGIEILPGRLSLESLAWVAGVLGDPAVGVPPFVGAPRLGTSNEFRWPIRVGFLSDPASRALARVLERHAQVDRGWLGELLDFVYPTGPDQTCDLLVVPGTLGQAIERVSAVPHGVDAACLVVLGGLGSASRESVDELRASLLEPIDPSAIAIVNVDREWRREWFVDLIRELSHDGSIDQAIRIATPRDGRVAPLVIADPESLDRMRVRVAATAAVETMREANGGGGVELSADVAVSFGLPPGIVPRTVVLDRITDSDAFFRESDGATATSRINRAAAPRPQLLAEPRWIQARVSHRTAGRNEEAQSGSLRPRTRYVLDFRIGPEDRDWLAAGEAFPPDAVPRDGKWHLLRVVFESDGRRRPMIGTVELPPEGASSSCRFAFRTASGTTYRGRLIVQFRNRVVQTAILTAGLSKRASTNPEAKLRLDIESVLRPGLADLSSRTAFDLAVVHNHDSDGRPSATTLAGDWARKINMDRIETLSSTIKRLLDRVAAAPGSYSMLSDQASTELLYALALNGVDLRKTIFSQGLPPEFTADGRVPRIQIVAADPNAFFPIEFLYDFPPPSTPALCANAKEALTRGHCDPIRFHGPMAPNGTIPVVCPVGFWSMSRVIERHLTPDEWVPSLIGYNFGLRSEPVTGRDRLGGLTSALFACSDRVAEADAKSVEARLKAATNNGSARVTSWDDWVSKVAEVAPDVLLLLAHTDRDIVSDQSGLSIEQGDVCLAGILNETYVRLDTPPALKDKPGPIVLLLGCDTARPWLEYQSFVVRFRNNRASLVVGTVATVPASHAANVARRVVQELQRSLKGLSAPGGGAGTAKPAAFGDILLSARRRILASGEVVGMCLTSYGDADWGFG